MRILDNLQINRKIKRMAYEVLESNFDAPLIFLLGINNNGYNFAGLLKKEIECISDKKIILSRIKLKPQNPVSNPIELECNKAELTENTVIVIDDVSNTGRTLFYAMQVLMDVLPFKVETAVLVDRMHKLFPVNINYVGISFATTLEENIIAKLAPSDNKTVDID